MNSVALTFSGLHKTSGLSQPEREYRFLRPRLSEARILPSRDQRERFRQAM